ncbi:hypothetical protein M404DRAFT_992713 [Pisolithus tinctorius Marx 270]|uniref:Uncharacterized protein n=1 Tax=Pisolithus tinctorius Marx 270 TaxID=870435 RepID=A0A0C3PGN3_PISTI|nr:hypothetical protein M404DRAFT_992713 [Pisolithus tinctorius Marx 270]
MIISRTKNRHARTPVTFTTPIQTVGLPRGAGERTGTFVCSQSRRAYDLANGSTCWGNGVRHPPVTSP